MDELIEQDEIWERFFFPPSDKEIKATLHKHAKKINDLEASDLQEAQKESEFQALRISMNALIWLLNERELHSERRPGYVS